MPTKKRKAKAKPYLKLQIRELGGFWYARVYAPGGYKGGKFVDWDWRISGSNQLNPYGQLDTRELAVEAGSHDLAAYKGAMAIQQAHHSETGWESLPTGKIEAQHRQQAQPMFGRVQLVPRGCDHDEDEPRGKKPGLN